MNWFFIEFLEKPPPPTAYPSCYKEGWQAKPDGVVSTLKLNILVFLLLYGVIYAIWVMSQASVPVCLL
jgi:hypothetical protein